MKKFLFLLSFLLFGTVMYSQIIDESIPKFCEKIISLQSQKVIKKDLVSRGFKMFSTEDLQSFGWSLNEAKATLFGTGNYKISCIANFYPDGLIRRVTVSDVKYLTIQGLFNEFEKAGYEMQGIANNGSYMFTNLPYVALVDWIEQNGQIVARVVMEK